MFWSITRHLLNNKDPRSITIEVASDGFVTSNKVQTPMKPTISMVDETPSRMWSLK